MLPLQAKGNATSPRKNKNASFSSRRSLKKTKFLFFMGEGVSTRAAEGRARENKK
jgi:hypothetical protein